jgi:hypothetical protein
MRLSAARKSCPGRVRRGGGRSGQRLKPFVAGDQVVEFQPRSEEDEEQAQQETDYVNYIAMERNNGFLVMNSAIKDALMLRAGYVKMAWTERNDVMVETYYGLSEDEMAAIQERQRS